jgi:hypothetical protein
VGLWPQLGRLRVRVRILRHVGVVLKSTRPACNQLLPGIDPSSVGFPRFPASWAFVFAVETREATRLQLPHLSSSSSSSTLGYLLLHFLSSISDAHLSLRNQLPLITTARRSWFDYWLPFRFHLPGAATLELSTLRISREVSHKVESFSFFSFFCFAPLGSQNVGTARF